MYAEQGGVDEDEKISTREVILSVIADHSGWGVRACVVRSLLGLVKSFNKIINVPRGSHESGKVFG